MEGILLETQKDVLKLVGTNLDLGIETYIEADIREEGSVVIPSRLLSEIIRKLPDAEIEVTLLGNYSVKIVCLNSLVTLQGFAPDEYPSLPDISESEPIEISKMLLAKMIRETILQSQQTNPSCTYGFSLEVEDGEVTMVSLTVTAWPCKRQNRKFRRHRKVIIPASL